jgi:hypothetical protein
MGHNDHLEDDRPELPPEAGKHTESGYEPNDEWLKTADPALRHEAMRTWFLSRFCDPANDTPYNSEEGGFLYIHGGPYDATDELDSRFSDVFEEDDIRAVVDDVESDGIYEWAPTNTDPDYDEEFEFEANKRGDAYQFFIERLNEADALAGVDIDPQRQPLLRQLLYSSLIAALEAYLADTVSYWVTVDRKVFRQFVSTCDDFKVQKLSLSQIFDRMDDLQHDVERYLQTLVWHRLDKVVPLLADSLNIARPEIGALMKHIVIRHDIVHRGGKTKDGRGVVITNETLNELRSDLFTFIEAVETQLKERFPEPSTASVGSADEL